MKKSNLRFETLSSKKYTTLTHNQSFKVLGGATTVTAGGSKQDGVQSMVMLDGKEYRATPMRCWSSDTVDADGVVCYRDETSTVVYTPY